MPARFICPHCHTPIDPLALDAAVCACMPCRVCPECDGLIPLYVEPTVQVETELDEPEAVTILLPSPESCPAIP